jgi:hypothetical protein
MTVTKSSRNLKGMGRSGRKVHQDNLHIHYAPTVLHSEIRSLANLAWEFSQRERPAAELGLPVFFRKFAVNQTFD